MDHWGLTELLMEPRPGLPFAPRLEGTQLSLWTEEQLGGPELEAQGKGTAAVLKVE